MRPIDHLARHTGKNEKTHRELDKFFTAVGHPGKKTSLVPWCAAAVGWSCIQAGYGEIFETIPLEHRLMARAWDVHERALAAKGVRRIGGPEAITGGLAEPGDIVTYTRSGTTRDRSKLASGHIDFFSSYDANKQRVYGLGGNESNMVRNGSSKLSRVLSVYRLPDLDIAEVSESKDKLLPLLPRLKAHEGGYSNHSDDPATNMGITIHTFRAYIKRDGTIADLKAMTFEQASIVYRAQYWNKLRCDDLPPGVDYAVFDFGVNSGPSRAAKFLQGVVKVEQDGEIGPITLAATKKLSAAHVAAAVCDNRLVWLRTLSKWGRYGNGWARRVAEVRAHSLELAATWTEQTTKRTGNEMKIGLILKIVKTLRSLTGDRVQSAGIGALVLSLIQGALGGGEELNPIGDILQGDKTAIGASIVAVVGMLKQFFVKTKAEPRSPVAIEPIAMPTEPLNDLEDGMPAQLDTDAIKDAVQDVMSGKTLDDAPEELAQAWANLASGKPLDVPGALRFGAALFKRSTIKGN